VAEPIVKWKMRMLATVSLAASLIIPFLIMCYWDGGFSRLSEFASTDVSGTCFISGMFAIFVMPITLFWYRDTGKMGQAIVAGGAVLLVMGITFWFILGWITSV